MLARKSCIYVIEIHNWLEMISLVSPPLSLHIARIWRSNIAFFHSDMVRILIDGTKSIVNNQRGGSVKAFLNDI